MSKEAARAVAAAVKIALVKAASDPDLAARMEKSANPFARLAGGIGRGLNKITPGLNRAWTRPAASGAGRQFSGARLGSTLGIGAGAGGGGAFAAGHLDNDADNTVGMSANPLTWGRSRMGRHLGMDQGPSEEDIFQRNSLKYNTAAQDIQSEMDAASRSGDTAKLKELNDRFQQGNFAPSHGWDLLDGKIGDLNPLKYRMGGLNPFATQTGSTYQNRMMQQQNALQGKFDAALKKSGPQPGDQERVTYLEEQMRRPGMLPRQAQAAQTELAALKRRMEQAPGTMNDEATAIQKRMSGAGMRQNPLTPAAPAGPAAGGGPSSGWNLGGRPMMPSYMQGQPMSAGNFRSYPRPWDAVQTDQSPFRHG